MKKYPNISPGQEVVVVNNGHTGVYYMACCDCHLVHKLKFKVKGNQVIMMGWRANHRTAGLRRHRGIPIKEKTPG